MLFQAEPSTRPPRGPTAALAPSLRRAALLLALSFAAPALLATAARADDPAPAASAEVELAPPEELRHFGLSIAGGVPNGAEATLVYRPVGWLRLGGSFLYNYFNMGAGLSATVGPRWTFAPTFTLEGGKYWNTNLTGKIGNPDKNLEPWIQDVGYSYVNAQVGLEIGGASRFVFFLRAGLTRLWVDDNPDTSKMAYNPNDTYLSYAAKPGVTAGTPCAKLGFLFYF